jgi:hypothetical protein
MTLTELLVALVLLSSVAVLSAQLVIQATRLTGTVARSSRNPDLTIATQWVRRDLYEALSVVGTTLGWSDGPLLMSGQNGGWTGLAVVDGELVRTHAPPGGLNVDTRVILQGVIGWRWRVDLGSSVTVEISCLVNPQAHENLTGAPSHRVGRRTERLVVALRGKPGGRAW